MQVYRLEYYKTFTSILNITIYVTLFVQLRHVHYHVLESLYLISQLYINLKNLSSATIVTINIHHS